MKKVELLAPAGNQEKLEFAVTYGADAVYLGIDGYSLRAGAGNFPPDELSAAVSYAHERGVKVYAALNIFAHNRDFSSLSPVLDAVGDSKVDALIVSDPGIFNIIRRQLPDIKIHISTQANVTNADAAGFWRQAGASRVNLARELSLAEIDEISAVSDIETEVFIHGAMCISYSGRCFLSKYLTGRNANQGDCAHSCRWKYYLTEEKRPGIYHPVLEDNRGFYFFNSNDLCLASFIPELIRAGVMSFKIEGRMKSLHYLATVVSVYRSIIDGYYEAGGNFRVKTECLAELEKVSHRRYSTGFLNGGIDNEAGESSGYIRDYDFVGVVRGYEREQARAVIDVRNRLNLGDELEILSPNGSCVTFRIPEIILAGESVSVSHANSRVEIPVDKEIIVSSIIRRANMRDTVTEGTR